MGLGTQCRGGHVNAFCLSTPVVYPGHITSVGLTLSIAESACQLEWRRLSPVSSSATGIVLEWYIGASSRMYRLVGIGHHRGNMVATGLSSNRSCHQMVVITPLMNIEVEELSRINGTQNGNIARNTIGTSIEHVIIITGRSPTVELLIIINSHQRYNLLVSF